MVSTFTVAVLLESGLTPLLPALSVALHMTSLISSAETVNDALIKALPYLLTLIVLAVASKRQRPPAAAGIPYIKGQAG